AIRESHRAAHVAWHAVHEVPGHGIEARDGDGACWRLGAAAWAGAPGHFAGTQAVLSRDGEPMARFRFDERLRDDAAAAVPALPPWAAGIGMASSSLFVVLNSLRLAR